MSMHNKCLNKNSFGVFKLDSRLRGNDVSLLYPAVLDIFCKGLCLSEN